MIEEAPTNASTETVQKEIDADKKTPAKKEECNINVTKGQEKYITEKEVAEITGRALSTLRNERFLGKGIPYSKIGKSVRYKYEDVIEFMEARRIETVY